MIAAGMEKHIPTPSTQSQGSTDYLREISFFASKFAIVCVVALLAIGVGYKIAAPRINTFAFKIKNIPNSLTQTPDIKIEQYTKLTKDLVNKFSPILNELKPVWSVNQQMCKKSE
jgi:hypothetical protein